mmetsp:Transcript_44234/g.61470  ORF Transcript_44234/g.61470 Transcript_44234/m.61470 type:complete len:121 (-) Transcript_44234:108-470(-)
MSTSESPQDLVVPLKFQKKQKTLCFVGKLPGVPFCAFLDRGRSPHIFDRNFANRAAAQDLLWCSMVFYTPATGNVLFFACGECDSRLADQRKSEEILVSNRCPIILPEQFRTWRPRAPCT